jgi:hypothetical protein
MPNELNSRGLTVAIWLASRRMKIYAKVQTNARGPSTWTKNNAGHLISSHSGAGIIGAESAIPRQPIVDRGRLGSGSVWRRQEHCNAVQ